MKKFFLALGVVAMMFGVAACGGSDPAYKSAKKDFCNKIQQCDDDMKCDDIKVKGDCEDEAKAAYECLNGLSCEEILSGAAKCQNKQDAFNSCQEGNGGGNGGDDDDDDDDEGGNGGGWDDDDDDDEGGNGGGWGDDDDDDWGDDDE